MPMKQAQLCPREIVIICKWFISTVMGKKLVCFCWTLGFVCLFDSGSSKCCTIWYCAATLDAPGA